MEPLPDDAPRRSGAVFVFMGTAEKRKVMKSVLKNEKGKEKERMNE